MTATDADTQKLDDRDETPRERADRNLIELLQEVRVAQTGIQVMFAFLLSVPFTNKFAELTAFERTDYYVSTLLAALAAILLTGPTAYHRMLFHQDDKQHVVWASNAFALAGLICVGTSMTGVVMLLSSVLYGSFAVVAAGGGIALVWTMLWLVVPWVRRIRVC